MKRKLICILLTLCTLLSLAACQDSPSPAPADPGPAVTEPEATGPETTPASEPEDEPEAPAMDPSLSQRDREWIEDIEYLRTEYKARHADPFYLVSEEVFDFRLDQLEAQVSQLSDTDIYFEISAVIAGMGDLHTTVYGADFLYERCFPATASYFDGKLYLTGCLEGYEELEPYLLREIVAVNGVDIAYINQKLVCFKNSYNTWCGQASFSFIPAFFDWVGCDYTEGYTFQILNENQKVESVELPVVSYEEKNSGTMIRPEHWEELFYLKGGSRVEYYDGENEGYIYMRLTGLPISSPSSLAVLARDVGRQREAHPECGKLVVDLRRCPGGDCGDLLGFQENIEAMRMEQVYVLTGSGSASGATMTMSFFQSYLGAVIVGEPTGQFPSMFHLNSTTLEPAVLPHSQITIPISNHWFDAKEVYNRYGWEPTVEEYYDEDGRLYPWENTILPDVYVHQDIEDIRLGRDSVLQWVLAQ